MSTTTDWFGIRKDGTQFMITHRDFMDWAHKNDKQITVGWSHHFQFSDDHDTPLRGARLVRGTDVGGAIKTAEEQGWNDLRDQLLLYAMHGPEIRSKGGRVD
jgi:hypothetical protein